MASHKVGIFPAAGGIGGSTVKHLLKRVPAKDSVFVARYPNKLASAIAEGATTRQADYDDKESLEHAFDGIDTLFLISYASVQHEERFARHRTAIDCAIKSGVKYIFYGSLGFAGSPENHESVAFVMKPHLDTEKYIEQCAREHSGFGYTIVREGLYSESYPLYTASFNPKTPSQDICIPHDGAGPGIAWVKREELGEGTAELLARFVRDPTSFSLRNQTVLLSGQTTLTLKDTVDILNEISGQPASIKQVSDAEYASQPSVVATFTYNGVDYSKNWATAFEAFRRGEAAFVSPLLKELLGREPEDFRTTVALRSADLSSTWV